MKKHTWSNEDRNEFDVLMARVLAEPKVAVRIDLFLEALEAALGKPKPERPAWAVEAAHQMSRDGADRIIKSEAGSRNPRVAVTHDNKVIGTAPREMGRKVRDDAGKVVHERSLFDFLTFAELRAKLDEFGSAIRALGVDRQLIRRLLTLEQMVPGALTPADACSRLGMTVEQFIESADNAA